MNAIIRLARELDIDGILQLQAKNLYTNLPQSKLAEGFVTTPITDDQIKQAIALAGVFVVENHGLIAGYTYAADWDYFAQWEIFSYMVSRFSKIEFKGHKISVNNTFQYGPVCIDKALRGTKVFPQLFETMRSNLASRFPIGLTFINQINQRSLAAHKKINLEIIDEFQFKDNSYYTLAFLTDTSI